MYREVLKGLVIACIFVSPGSKTGAQPARPAAEAPEIKLDEQTTLKATALEARMAAVVANFALLQRQAQDMQQELKQILEDRKKLIEDAAKKNRIDVGDPNEWMFENKGQRYVKIRRTP
jgi:hypothetical protein